MPKLPQLTPQDAPDEVKDVYAKFRVCTNRLLELSSEAIELADAYISHNILTQNFRNDAVILQ